MGLTTTNVENVVELVVEILAHTECDPLPKLTLGNELYRDHKLASWDDKLDLEVKRCIE